MANPITDHDIIVQYNRENGTNFYNIKQVNEDKLKKAEAHKVWANDDETVGSSRFRATNSAVHNAPTKKQATKIALDAAKQRGIETATMAAVAAAPHILPVIANPATASTTVGAVAATGLDTAGLIGGLNQLNNYWNNRKNLTFNDTPGILLSGLSLWPGSSQLTNPRNLNIATNAIRNLNPAFKYRSLLERVKVNPELAPYYNDAASARIKFTLKNDGTYNPDTHTVTLPLFGNKRTIAHEMGHAALRGGEMDIPNYDYTGAGLNKGNEAAADWFAGNLNERYYGKDAVIQARQTTVDNFDIIRHSLADGTLRFGEPTTYNGVHQSSKSMQQFEFPYQRWDVINHGADPNGAFFTLDKPAESGFLAKRPYTSYWEIKSQKPLIQIGEIRGPGNTKNNIRNAIVDYARKNGADAVEFRGIADNNLQNQNILFATDKSGIKFKYESPVTEVKDVLKSKGMQTPKDMTTRYYDGKWHIENVVNDFKAGKEDAVEYLTSDLKKAVDKHNIELAKHLGWEISPEINPGKAKINMVRRDNDYELDPRFTWIGQPNNGFYLSVGGLKDSDAEVGMVKDMPQFDRMAINFNTDISDKSFHEHLHRGDLGRIPHRSVYTKHQQDVAKNTGKFYDWKTEKLLLPMSEVDSDSYLIDSYLREAGESPVNFMEIGRRAGINPGEAYPGKQAALSKIKSIIENDENLGYYLTRTVYQQKPKRVWSALNGTYYTLPVIGLLGTNLINNNNE